jgi:hypothetical protein
MANDAKFPHMRGGEPVWSRGRMEEPMVVEILALVALVLAVLSLIPATSSYPLLNCAVLLLAVALALPLLHR